MFSSAEKFYINKCYNYCNYCSTWHVGGPRLSRVQPPGSDSDHAGQGSKHFPKWVNIWQPEWNEFGDMWILGHIFRAFVKCFKMKQEVGKFMALAPTLLPPLSQDRHEDGDKTVCQQFGWVVELTHCLMEQKFKGIWSLLKGALRLFYTARSVYLSWGVT